MSGVLPAAAERHTRYHRHEVLQKGTEQTRRRRYVVRRTCAFQHNIVPILPVGVNEVRKIRHRNTYRNELVELDGERCSWISAKSK
jgi:hypothetical protein